MINKLKNYKLAEHGEYLNNKYPKDFFSFVLDIGSRGIKHTWHIHKMAEFSPNTRFIGFEPDIPYAEEIKNLAKQLGLSNVSISTDAFGKKDIITPQGVSKSIDLIEIFKKYELDKNKAWHFKCDAEGAEHYLLECKESVEILKTSSHISFELHHDVCVNYNFFIISKCFKIN